jgi:hypothetical protein
MQKEALGTKKRCWVYFDVSQRKPELLEAAMYERKFMNREMGELYNELRVEDPAG